MSLKKSLIISVLIISATLFDSVAAFGAETKPTTYMDIQYTPWDVLAASDNIVPQARKAATIMIYMNGSDLESENGAATDDLLEMLNSGVDTEAVNIMLFTGGTNRWQNNVIPANECVIWKLADDGLEELVGVGLLNMGNAGTLAGFLEFSMKNFPADKYGLIMWDHGGGSIAGYGHDEKFVDGNLTLPELRYAFQKAGLAENKLEFLGFDSCLMATVEMAVIASDYANYLVASEDLEPGEGWNYDFLSSLNGGVLEGAEFGIAVTDSFMDFYGTNSDEFLTMSVIDLSKVGDVMNAMGDLMAKCSAELMTEREPTFTTFAGKRFGTKTFGEGSPRDNECDMVDIGDMARKLSDLYPAESAKIVSALESSVLYNRHNSNTDIMGLSTFYIYGGKDSARVSLPVYESLGMDSNYTSYLYDFARILNAKGTSDRVSRSRSAERSVPQIDELACAELIMWKPVDDGYFIMTGMLGGVDVNPDGTWSGDGNILWPKISGQEVCMNEVNSASGHSLFAIPAKLNDRDCNIMVLFNQSHPEGRILGGRQDDGFIIQKGFDKLNDGDRIAFYYRKCYFGVDGEQKVDIWHLGEEFTVNGDLEVKWSAIDSEVYYGLRLIDIWHNEYFTGLERYESEAA